VCGERGGGTFLISIKHCVSFGGGGFGWSTAPHESFQLPWFHGLIHPPTSIQSTRE
jgi:hypothetical protein